MVAALFEAAAVSVSVDVKREENIASVVEPDGSTSASTLILTAVGSDPLRRGGAPGEQSERDRKDA